MIKSFIFSLILAIVSVGVIIGGEEVFSKFGQTKDIDLALVNNDEVSLASEDDSESPSNFTLLLGKDGTIVDTATTSVGITISDPDNYSYKY